MISRKMVTTLLSIGLVGAVIVSAPYWLPLAKFHSDKSLRPEVALADLKTASYVEVELETSRVFVLRDFDDQVYVFSVPYSNTAYWLPEFDWSHPAIPCAQVEPDHKNGMLVEDGRFRCVLPDYGEFFRREHSWSYSGKNQGYRTADMKIAKHELTDESILLSPWK
jgi:hypothetical protein